VHCRRTNRRCSRSVTRRVPPSISHTRRPPSSSCPTPSQQCRGPSKRSSRSTMSAMPSSTSSTRFSRTPGAPRTPRPASTPKRHRRRRGDLATRVHRPPGSLVGPGAVLYEDTEIGRDCVIGPGAIIGWVSPTTTEAMGSGASLRILPARGSATASTWAHTPASVAACSQIRRLPPTRSSAASSMSATASTLPNGPGSRPERQLQDTQR
jgi:hypothetical protein